jgi:hypothetical protein
LGEHGLDGKFVANKPELLEQTELLQTFDLKI